MIIQQVAQDGLQGKQHLYITFSTTHPHVQLPASLLEEYPDEMTIILQHEFWDLVVSESDVSVMLAFEDQYETIRIPFDAVIELSDPSEDFTLELDPAVTNDRIDTPKDSSSAGASIEQKTSESGQIIDFSTFHKKK
jgi:hypothetical protein